MDLESTAIKEHILELKQYYQNESDRLESKANSLGPLQRNVDSQIKKQAYLTRIAAYSRFIDELDDLLGYIE